MVGIYKITNPIGEIYIGYSKDINRRFKEYQNYKFKTQKLLKESIQKYNLENHKFEIVEECSLSNLKLKEKYWIEYYNSYKKGLNSNKGGGGVIQHANFSKKKMSKSHTGLKDTLETKLKKSQSQTGIKRSKYKNKGVSLTENHKQNIGKSNSKPKPKDFGKKLSKILKGKNKHTFQSKSQISKKLTNHPSLLSIGRKNKISKSNSKPILQYDLKNNLIQEWESATQASRKLNLPQPNINAACLGKQKTAYGFIWTYKLNYQEQWHQITTLMKYSEKNEL